LRRGGKRKDCNTLFLKKGVYEKMGLQHDDEKMTKATKEGVGTSGQPSELHDGCDDDDDLGYMDHLTYEEASLCDWKNPVMMLQSRYKDMCTF
jgi:hypothetical protein